MEKTVRWEVLPFSTCQSLKSCQGGSMHAMASSDIEPRRRAELCSTSFSDDPFGRLISVTGNLQQAKEVFKELVQLDPYDHY